MPFSFIEIEKEKSRLIGFFFFFLLFFYFITAYLILIVLNNTLLSNLLEASHGGGPVFPSLQHTIITFGIALLTAFAHWSVSTSHLIEKMCTAVGAVPADDQDVYHHYLKNIVDEVSVAIGGRPIEAWVINSSSMNAFALEDFKGRAIIGVTEGVLARLNRAQIEAVIAHEAGHIASGDCLSTTVSCALAEIYDETISRLNAGLRNTRGRGGFFLILIYLVIGLMRFLSSLVRYFISRQREYRADAIGVRLSRDPLSLAEALSLISERWHGQGALGDKMQSIFIINPELNQWDESEGFAADLFSTHPPIKSRVRILCDMAHLDEKTLEENLKNFKHISPVAEAEVKTDDDKEPHAWFVFCDQKWLGPFDASAIEGLQGVTPDQWIRRDGETTSRHLYEEPLLLNIFKKKDGGDPSIACPHCRLGLEAMSYEGAPVFRCGHCQGTFVSYDKISRLFLRKDKQFSDEIKHLAETIMKDKEVLAKSLKKADPKDAWVLDCPKCQRKMRRQFFVYSYPVEIDRCIYCDGIWFDAKELEILQYFYEHKEEFFDGEHF